MGSTYAFGYVEPSTYSHVRQLVNAHAKPGGLILDIGCGLAAIAEPLIADGFDYVGIDIDQDSLDQIAARGIQTLRVDGRSLPSAQRDLQKLIDGRPVSAVLMLDYLEHIVDTDGTLASFSGLVAHDPETVWVLSVPNVTHVDVASKLLFGKFDYTLSGLLDHTHVRFFDEAHLVGCMTVHGWNQIGINDYEVRVSDQRFPIDSPEIAEESELARLLRDVAIKANPHAFTQQFVRAFMRDTQSRDAAELSGVDNSNGWIQPILDQPQLSQRQRMLSIIMRTQGSDSRLGGLDEALTCLAGQIDQRFEVLLLVHAADQAQLVQRRASVASLVARYGPAFAEQIRIIDVVGGDRARPLNVGLEHVRGDLVAFLDDDDYVTVDFVSTINEAMFVAPGRIIRTVAAERFNKHIDVPVSFAETTTTVSIQAEPFRYGFNKTFDYLRHYWQNETPIHTFAIPTRAIDTFGWRFDESLTVVEDWHFLMRAASLLGIHDTEVATSIYNRWISTEVATSADIDRSRWHQAQLNVLAQLGQSHVILPLGSPRKIYERTEAWQHSRPVVPVGELARELAQRAPQAVVAKTRRALRPRTRLWALRLWWRNKRSK